MGRQALESFLGELRTPAVLIAETFVDRYNMHRESVFAVEFASTVRTRIGLLFRVSSFMSCNLKTTRSLLGKESESASVQGVRRRSDSYPRGEFCRKTAESAFERRQFGLIFRQQRALLRREYWRCVVCKLHEIHRTHRILQI